MTADDPADWIDEQRSVHLWLPNTPEWGFRSPEAGRQVTAAVGAHFSAPSETLFHPQHREEPDSMTDSVPKASARDHQRALRAAVNYAQGDFDIMPALAAEIGQDVDWFVLALLAEFVDDLDRRFGRPGAVTYLSGRLAAASEAAEREQQDGDE